MMLVVGDATHREGIALVADGLAHDIVEVVQVRSPTVTVLYVFPSLASVNVPAAADCCVRVGVCAKAVQTAAAITVIAFAAFIIISPHYQSAEVYPLSQ